MQSRRQFLKWAVVGIGASSNGLAPAWRFLRPEGTMDKIDWLPLFDAASRFDKTSPCPKLVEDSDSPLDGVGKALGRKEAPGNTFYMGNGVQLDKYLPALVNNKRAAVIRLEDLDHWFVNLREVMRILHTFLLLARERPAMLWSHTVCWTDRAVQRYANNVLVDDDNTHNDPIERSHGDVVRLHFEPKSRRRVTVRTDALRWLRPNGIADSKGPLLKIAKRRVHLDLARGYRVVGGSYGETIGASSEDWRDDPLVNGGRLPGLRSIMYGLDINPRGNSRLLLPGHECLDPTGILDVFLLKALRLFRRPRSVALDDVMADQVVFAFDREGLVAYITVSSQRFEGWTAESRWGSHLVDWMGRNCSRGKVL